MNKITELKQAAGLYTDTSGRWANADAIDRLVELIIANTAELKPVTDPINKPFELNPKFTSKCDAIGRSRRQFQ